MDNVIDIFTYEKAADPVKTYIYNDRGTFVDKEEYKFEMNLDLDFSDVQAFTYSYFTTLDVLSAIGGLGNAIKIALGALVPFLTLRFMVEFSSIHQRKAKQKIRIFKLKDIVNNLKELRKKIQAAKGGKNADECDKALEAIAEDSRNFKIVKVLSKEAKTLASKDDDLGDITYAMTKKVLREWAAIRDKYYPESDRWGPEGKKWSGDAYETEERDEERKKYEFYVERATSNFWTLIPLAQFRLSLMSIFYLTDEVKFNGHKTKKLRNQLRIAIDEISGLKDEIKTLKS